MIVESELQAAREKLSPLPDIAPLSSDDFRDLVKRRAVSVLHLTPDEQAWATNEELRRETERRLLEKINRDSNLLPVDFLSKGVERAKAVGRIMTPSGLGTGFLIDRGVIMTNNHVLHDIEEAGLSFIEFDYEENKNVIKVKLKPSELFITVKELDFTIVACESAGIEQITPVKLLRSPTTITRGEYVNIIQHPRGRKKEIALQDNTVSYVYDKVIHYSTDTEAGSSGAAVFNNKWELVALHRAGLNETTPLNEGVRISAIVSKLISMAHRGDTGAARITRTLEDRSPYLGYYDVAGLIDSQEALLEVEVPSYKGDKRFADIGFWNIEHFNNTSDRQRIKDVARVVANLSMDVLGLVEVERGALDRLIEAIKQHNGTVMKYVYLDSTGNQDLAVLYDTATTVVELRDDINRKYSDLLHSTVANKPAFPQQREPLFAKCTIKEEGKDVEFLMIVVHLKAMRDPESTERRKLAAEIISVIIEDLKRDEAFRHLPIVLGGDLNDDAGSVSLSPIMNSPSLVTLTRDDADAGHISYLEDPFSLIDHIIVSRDMNVGSIQQDDAAIVRLDQSVQQFVKDISDHAPLVLRVIYRDEEALALPGLLPRLPSVQFMAGSTLERTMLKLELNRSHLDNERIYYDEEKDRLSIVDYYRSVNLRSGSGEEQFRDLHRLLLHSHTNVLAYDRSRSELYSWVDLREDGKLRSLYSSRDLDPERLIREDYVFEQQKREFLEALPHLERMNAEELQHMLDEKFQFNVEHVVPQSWFGKRNPMLGDMHHLFVCEADCNSFRGNVPYFDFADYTPEAYQETIRNECGKRGGTIKFEPENGKGEAARAVLYFLLRYPGKINGNQRIRIDIEMLLSWHREHPVTMHEKHRNRAIFELQGNRNPLIDFPEAADRIRFELGL